MLNVGATLCGRPHQNYHRSRRARSPGRAAFRSQISTFSLSCPSGTLPRWGREPRRTLGASILRQAVMSAAPLPPPAGEGAAAAAGEGERQDYRVAPTLRPCFPPRATRGAAARSGDRSLRRGNRRDLRATTQGRPYEHDLAKSQFETAVSRSPDASIPPSSDGGMRVQVTWFFRFRLSLTPRRWSGPRCGSPRSTRPRRRRRGRGRAGGGSCCRPG